MSIIEAVRTFLLTFDLIGEGKVGVDYLLSDPDNYSIEQIPNEPILSTDIMGNTERQYLFQFASKETWGSDEIKNMQNTEFYENFSNWLELKTYRGELPDLGEGKKAVKIYAQGAGFIAEIESEGLAKYVIRCGLIYKQEAVQ